MGWAHLVPMSQRRPIFLRQWREYRGLSQERLAGRIGISKGQLSKIEKGNRQYTQDFLEAAAEALECSPADILMRDPTDPDGIWSIWDYAEPGEKRQIVNVAKALIDAKKTGTLK